MGGIVAAGRTGVAVLYDHLAGAGRDETNHHARDLLGCSSPLGQTYSSYVSFSRRRSCWSQRGFCSRRAWLTVFARYMLSVYDDAHHHRYQQPHQPPPPQQQQQAAA
ncbi:unnamed protein product, partial [Ectocarpus sp. 6 AP-2014]